MDTPKPTSPAIELRNVTFAYPLAPRGLPAIEDATLSVEANDYLGIVGPNGGGKTTLLKIILGLCRPQRGDVRLLGADPLVTRCDVGYVPQHAGIDTTVAATVFDVVLCGRLSRRPWALRYRPQDLRRAAEALDQVGVADLARRALRDLSGGQRQRVLIARALAGEPRLLILDEPTAGVDVPAEHSLHDLLAQLNKRMPIVLVSHDVGFISAQVKRIACVNRRLVCHAAGEIAGDVIGQMYHDHGHVRPVDHVHDCPTQPPRSRA